MEITPGPSTDLGIASVSTTGGASTITAAQALSGIIVITGALASNATLSFGSGSAAFFNRPYIVQNSTTGIFTLTVNACVTGPTSSLVIPQGTSIDVYTNNTAISAVGGAMSMGLSIATRMGAFYG